MAKQKTIWMVIDSDSSCMPSLKKVLFRSESLKECRAFREGMDDNFRITTQREIRKKKEDPDDY